MSCVIPKDYIYINNVISPEIQDLIIDQIFFDWANDLRFSYEQHTVTNNAESFLEEHVFKLHPNVNIDRSKIKEHFQFVHTFDYKGLESTGYKFLFYHLIQSLNDNVEGWVERNPESMRGKINIVTPQPDYPVDGYSMPHTDSDQNNFYTLLYYINDSDGDTKLFMDDGEILSFSPKKGSALLFRSNIVHSGRPPEKSANRAVINYLFKLGE